MVLSATVMPFAETLPSNTLRVYINFTEPMRRGQVATHIHLENDKGSKIENVFLSLGAELWNEDQTRLTLLFDPGRVKQGVGPNVRYGPPLKVGEIIYLVISQDMRSARGITFGRAQRVRFVVGDPERRIIDLDSLAINLPSANTTDRLNIKFDRLMDIGAANRFIRIRNEFREPVAGLVECDGKNWSFTPTTKWSETRYEILIHPSLEDVAGNTPLAAFDKAVGESTYDAKPISLPFMLTASLSN